MAFSNQIETKVLEIFGNQPVNNILHIGGCLAEERYFYEKLKPKKIYWFEPHPDLKEKIEENIKTDQYESILFPYAVGKENKKLPFHIITDDAGTNPGCSSLRHLKEHSRLYPNIKFRKSIEVDVVNLDMFLDSNNLEKTFDFVSLDTQGNDFDILSSSEYIFTAKCIVIETADIELYEGQIVERDLTEFLESKGYFKNYYSPWSHNWGDTLYQKK